MSTGLFVFTHEVLSCLSVFFVLIGICKQHKMIIYKQVSFNEEILYTF